MKNCAYIVLPKNNISGMVSSVAVPDGVAAFGSDGVVDDTELKEFQAPNAEDVPPSVVLEISIRSIRLSF